MIPAGEALRIYLVATLAMLVVCARRSGIVASLAFVGTLCLVGFLPQSNELRYYMFIPVTWAAAIGMLFPQFRASFPPAGLALLVLALGLFLHMVSENATHYEISKVDYQEAARQSGVTQWWTKLEPGKEVLRRRHGADRHLPDRTDHVGIFDRRSEQRSALPTRQHRRDERWYPGP